MIRVSISTDLVLDVLVQGGEVKQQFIIEGLSDSTAMSGIAATTIEKRMGILQTRLSR